jgi:3-hydroxypropanoate dehydrogenase
MGVLARATRRTPGCDFDALFRPADDAGGWSPQPVSRETLDELHALMSLGPALLDASPTRALFLTSSGAKARLAPYIAEAERSDVLAAPVCGVVGYDTAFAEQLAEFLPKGPGQLDDSEAAHRIALGNGALQGAYLVVAARSLGLEAVAISEFDVGGVSSEFFRNPRIRATFLCRLGYAAAPPA